MSSSVPSPSELPVKQQRFIEEYVACGFNATEAAIRAGYSKKTARAQGSRLLTNVDIQKALADRYSALAERADVSAERVLEELSRVAFSDLSQVGSWDGEGRVRVTPSDELSPEALATLRKLRRRHRRTTTKSGDEIETTTLDVEQHDKIRALKVLAEVTGLTDGAAGPKAGPTVIVAPIAFGFLREPLTPSGREFDVGPESEGDRS